MKVGVDHAELGTEKGQGISFRAWAGADHLVVTEGRQEGGWGVVGHIG